MRGGWGTLPANARLNRGARGPQVAALKRRLAIEGDLAPGAAIGDLFDEAPAHLGDRALDELDDAVERSIANSAGGSNLQRAFTVDRAGKHLFSLGFLDGNGFAGDRVPPLGRFARGASDALLKSPGRGGLSGWTAGAAR